MGAADVAPGVSGGTMALLLGIYDELVAALRSVTERPFWEALSRGRLVAAFNYARIPFLVALLGGILTSVFLLAHLITWLFDHRPVLITAFFFGLVAASVLVVARRVERWGPRAALLFMTGAVGAWLMVDLTPTQTPDAPWFVFLSMALAVCALILPGISGAFVLVLLGKYQLLLEAVAARDLGTLAIGFAGGVAGLLSFARVLAWLLSRHRHATLATLTGLMLGSLRKVWPYQEDAGGTQVLVLPAGSWLDPQTGLVWAALIAVIGAGAVLLLDNLAARHE